MPKSCLSLVLIFLSMPAPAYGQASATRPVQSNCSLAEAPAIRGFKLGMAASEILALLPENSEAQINKRAVASADSAPNYGVASLSFHPSYYPTQELARFAGIDSIAITLFDGNVVELRVVYAGPNSAPRGPAWETIDAFITKLSEALGLPESGYWAYTYTGSNSRIVKCGTFEIEATAVSGQGSLRLHRTGYEDVVRRRAAAEEERMRRAFKP